MNKLKPMLHEINNADQMIQGARELIDTDRPLDHEQLVSLQKFLDRAIQLFRTAEDKVLEAITDDLNDLLDTIPDEDYNHAKESGDVDYSREDEAREIRQRGY